MHIITVSAIGCECDCGFKKDTLTRLEASAAAHIHAEQNTPAMVTDTRFFPKKNTELIEGATDGE